MIDFKAFREDNKLTQVKAAAYFGCKQSFISQIESGYRPVPDTFISKVLSDISMDGTHMTPDENEVMTETCNGGRTDGACKICRNAV